MTDDPLQSYYILASEMFPDMPPDEAVQRFATKDGNIVYLDTDGVKRVRPSMFKSDGFSDTAARLGQCRAGW